MATQSGHARVTITVPAMLLDEWKNEARVQGRTVSELIVRLIMSARQMDQDFQREVLGRLASIDQLRVEMEKIVLLLEGSRLPKPDRDAGQPQRKIATYEEMYGPITPTPDHQPMDRASIIPARKRWPWSS